MPIDSMIVTMRRQGTAYVIESTATELQRLTRPPRLIASHRRKPGQATGLVHAVPEPSIRVAPIDDRRFVMEFDSAPSPALLMMMASVHLLDDDPERDEGWIPYESMDPLW